MFCFVVFYFWENIINCSEGCKFLQKKVCNVIVFFFFFFMAMKAAHKNMGMDKVDELMQDIADQKELAEGFQQQFQNL